MSIILFSTHQVSSASIFQNSHVLVSCNYSQDSLEYEDNNHGGSILRNSHFYLFNSEKPPHASDLTSSAMRLLDGNLSATEILLPAKNGKETSGDAACGPGSGLFSEQVAFGIKDSVELTWAKMKEVKSNTTKKKVHWCDEVYLAKKTLEDHQQSRSTVSGAPKPGPSVTPAASTGDHVTKQAWADVGVQVSLPQERAAEVKVLQSATRPIGPKVPCREGSARARAAPVSSRGRKGTIIRPQSATEVNRMARTQGMNTVPRPPPRMEANERGPCLNCTPTEEEISALWLGVRSALATKDGNVYFGRPALTLLRPRIVCLQRRVI